MKSKESRGMSPLRRAVVRELERQVKAAPKEDPYTDLAEVAQRAAGEHRPRLFRRG